MSSVAPEDPQSVYDFTVKDTFGKDVSLKKYKGKVLLIVNIASRCGHTKKNYNELTELSEKYEDKGYFCEYIFHNETYNQSIYLLTDFSILSFPCNQFGKQMPQSDGEDMMCHLEKRNANVGDVFQKITVNGKDASPLYTYLKETLGGGNVRWNFQKFLVDKNGQPVERFASSISPLSIAPKIDELLEK